METKFDIKIIWNQMLRGEIKNKIQLEKRIKNKQTTINKMRIKSDIKIKLNDEGQNWWKQSIKK